MLHHHCDGVLDTMGKSYHCAFRMTYDEQNEHTIRREFGRSGHQRHMKFLTSMNSLWDDAQAGLSDLLLCDAAKIV